VELKEYPYVGERVWCDVLDNGLKFFFVPKADFNKTTAFFATNYGGADRRFRLGGKWVDTPAGVAHFLEHKMFDMPEGENALTRLSALGANANAFTSVDMTAYHFESVERFREAYELLLQFVSVPYFTRESVKKEQGIIGQEIRMTEDEPGECLYYGLMRQLFREHPLRDPVVGTVESIGEITPETLYLCHKVFYDPSNMALVVVGRGDPDELRDIAAEILPAGAGMPPVKDYGAKEDLVPRGSRVTKKMAVGMPIFFAGCRTAAELRGRRAQKYELTAALALSTLMGRSSPLFSRLYDEGLINDTFSYSFDNAAGISYALFGGDSDEPDRVVEAVLQEAERFGREGPEQAFFERRKKAAYGHAIRELNLFDEICYNMAAAAFTGYDYFEAPRMIAEITAEDVRAFIAKNLTPAMTAVSIIETQEG